MADVPVRDLSRCSGVPVLIFLSRQRDSLGGSGQVYVESPPASVDGRLGCADLIGQASDRHVRGAAFRDRFFHFLTCGEEISQGSVEPGFGFSKVLRVGLGPHRSYSVPGQNQVEVRP